MDKFIIHRKALDWWQNLEIPKVMEIMEKHCPGRVEASLSVREIAVMWAQETGNDDMLTDADIEEGERSAAEMDGSVEQEIFDRENPNI